MSERLEYYTSTMDMLSSEGLKLSDAMGISMSLSLLYGSML